MKTGRLTALALSLVIAAGTAGCSYSPAETTAGLETAQTSAKAAVAETTAAASESVPGETGTGSYAEKPALEVKDSESGKLVVWSCNDELKDLIDAYLPGKDYEYVVFSPDEYKSRLDTAMESGEAPDMFVCDYDYVRHYANSDNTLSINAAGIPNKACADMYDYTLRLACDDSGNIKGLAWALSPSAVFYQKSLAQQYLGSSEPAQVAKEFSSWGSFLAAARKVSKESEGGVKIIAGTDEIFKSYLGSRSNPWKTDGKLHVDSVAEGYLGFSKTINSEKLTSGFQKGSDEWKAGMRNKTVLSYWGTLSFARSSDFALDPSLIQKANPTSGDWGIVAPPGAFCSGGSWLMVSSNCDMKKTCADIITAICCDQGNLRDMLASGKCDFVNSRTVISAAASDERYEFAWLGGQNPYSVLGSVADKTDVTPVGSDDPEINGVFSKIVSVYSEGGFKSVQDAKATFRELLIEKKIVKE